MTRAFNIGWIVGGVSALTIDIYPIWEILLVSATLYLCGRVLAECGR